MPETLNPDGVETARLRRDEPLAIIKRIVVARASDSLLPRWIFLRALGAVFFSAFYSLAYQIHGLIGERGILPAQEYFTRVSAAVPGIKRLWYVPSVVWLDSSDRSLSIVVGCGIVAS